MQTLRILDFLDEPARQGKEHTFRRKIRKGEYLYLPGEAQHWVYLVTGGALKIGSYSPDGEQVAYDIVTPGDILGDLDYLDEVTFFEYAKALCAAEVVGIRTPVFKALVTREPELSEWFQQMVVRRWWKAEHRLFTMARGSSEARLNYLRHQFDRTLTDGNGRVCVLKDMLSLQDWADLAGVTRQTVAKKMKKPVLQEPL